MKHLLLFLALSFILTSCGEKPEEVVGFDSSDAEMNQAIQDARTSSDEFITLLAKTDPDRRYLAKFKVESDGAIEHMWAEPVKFENGQFEGTLVNEPYHIKSIKAGDTLRAPKNEISDWAVVSKSGEILAGGYTIKVMQKKQGTSP